MARLHLNCTCMLLIGHVLWESCFLHATVAFTTKTVASTRQPFYAEELRDRHSRAMTTNTHNAGINESSTQSHGRDILKRVFGTIAPSDRREEAELLQRAADEHHQDVLIARSQFSTEEDLSSRKSPLSEEDALWIQSDVTDRLALQTTRPLLSKSEVEQIRSAAQDLWSSGTTKSRFTYQRSGNYEAHLSDLKGVPVDSLLARVYPLLQSAFQLSSPLCIYDALVIRYNATEAPSGAAGQPLHRDQGLLSVNLQLNKGFQGGGTFLENQDLSKPPLKPLGVGHALCHWSHERHAGAATTQGVRDILVLFCMSMAHSRWELGARLKSQKTRLARCLAIEQVPTDGDAWHFLGMELLEECPDLALECLKHAITFTPRDARLYNNLGLAYKHVGADPSTILAAYQRSMELHSLAQAAGCDVTTDFDSVRLNFALYLSCQDAFSEACDVLRGVSPPQGSPPSRAQLDASRLLHFCELQLSQT